MKTILLAACAAIAMTATSVQAKTPGPFAAKTTFKLKLESIQKAENNQAKPGLKLFDGVPKGLVKGKTYEFKIGSDGQLIGPKGINIRYAEDDRLTALSLSYLKVANGIFYAEKEASGFMDLNVSIEFAAAFRQNKKGKPVALSISYIDTKIIPFNSKQVVFTFEKP